MSWRRKDEYDDFEDTEVIKALGFDKNLIIDSDDEEKLDQMKQIEWETILTERREKLIDWAEKQRYHWSGKERQALALKNMRKWKWNRE